MNRVMLTAHGQAVRYPVVTPSQYPATPPAPHPSHYGAARPPVWVYEEHSHSLPDDVLIDLYVSLRTLALPVRLEVQEQVLRREIQRRMGVR